MALVVVEAEVTTHLQIGQVIHQSSTNLSGRRITVAARIVLGSQHVALHRIIEAVEHESARIELLCTVSCIEVSEPSLLEALLDGQVEHRLFLTVVNTGDTAKVRLLVIGLHLVHNLCRQVLHGHALVVAEELLTAHEDAPHGLAVHLDGAILDGHTWQFLDEVFEHTSFWHLECVGIEDEGVVLHLHFLQLCRHHRRCQFDAALGHHDGANGHVAFVFLLVDRDFLEEITIAHIRHL